jgi:NAD kinase
MTAYEKCVLVTRKTRLEELVERFNSRAQAKFWIEHAGGDFRDYEREDDAYRRALDTVRGAVARMLRVHVAERSFVPTMLFCEKDLVVTLGQDGLVANTAKYVGDQPIVAVNPEPERFDGILLPFRVSTGARAVAGVLGGRCRERRVTLAQAELNDGQRLLAFNDFFVGTRSHVSARYRITAAGRTEPQSSSGVLVATGAGSTGWLSSCLNMAAGVMALNGGASKRPEMKLAWEDDRLAFVVREPFASRTSQVGIVAGFVAAGGELVIESLMPSGGCIFSDGMEADFLAFNSGSVARLRVAGRKARLIVE